MRRTDALLPLLLLISPPAIAAAPPDAAALLSTALEGSGASYSGQIMITRWFGKQTRAEEVVVYHAPENRYRWEFLKSDGGPGRVVISDGSREELHLGPRTTLDGLAPKSQAKRMGPEWEQDLLLKNYQLVASGEEPVVGRKTWVLELVPKHAGKAHQKLWIDEKTGVILQNRRFRPGGPFAALSRFTRFEPKEQPDSLFSLQNAKAGTVDAHGLDPDFFSMEQLSKALGKPSKFPSAIPGDFVFESADFFQIGERPVRHIRYTDGLAMISLFETDRPVRLSGAAAQASSASASLPGSMRFSVSGPVLNWQQGKSYYTLVGDVSRELLVEISEQLKKK